MCGEIFGQRGYIIFKVIDLKNIYIRKVIMILFILLSLLIIDFKYIIT